MIEIAIVDDEESYVALLIEYLKKYEKESGNTFHITTYNDGDNLVSDYRCQFDIILMDIQMKFMDGMSAAEEIRKRDQKVLIMFITNMMDYAIRGYEVDALDYVVKPVEYFSFSQKINRAISRVSKRSGHELSVSVQGGMKRVSSQSIYFIESDGHHLLFHTSEGQFSTRAKMQDYDDKLSSHGFFRSNKGILVNLKYVEGVEDGCAIIFNHKLPISRSKKNDFMKALTKYISEG
ncbi:MAG: LytTR family DNA-binding domain-containing protein [Lachnospiraceae bacterium]|nr:LytTR family DNA-binding domain-containing protein [Lachnospiraceae bacterium]